MHLRFDIQASSLPPFYKERLLALNDQRISGDGVVVIKAQQYRTQEQNREDALERLAELIRSVAQGAEGAPPDQAYARLAEAPAGRQGQARRGEGRARQGGFLIRPVFATDQRTAWATGWPRPRSRSRCRR